MTEEIKAEGICLRATEFGEGDKIVTLLTDSCGKIAVKVRGVASPKSRLRHAAAPFAFGTYILFRKNGFYSLKSFDYSDPFTSISDDLLRYYLGAAALEIADKLTEESAPVTREMTRLLRFIMALCYDGGALPAFVDYVLDMLKIAGYGIGEGDFSPSLDPRFFVFDLEEGCLRSRDKKPPYCLRLSSSACLLLSRFLEGENPNAENALYTELLSLFSQYLRYKTGGTVKSFFELSALLRLKI